MAPHVSTAARASRSSLFRLPLANPRRAQRVALCTGVAIGVVAGLGLPGCSGGRGAGAGGGAGAGAAGEDRAGDRAGISTEGKTDESPLTADLAAQLDWLEKAKAANGQAGANEG